MLCLLFVIDVLVILLYIEGLLILLLEGMVLGCVVVCMWVGGILSVVEDG